MTKIIHISDIHFKSNWNEEINVVLDEFIQDIGKKINEWDDKTYLLITGDIVQSASNSEDYNNFNIEFLSKIREVGIDSKEIIIIPGNHDACRHEIIRSKYDHMLLKDKAFTETEFNEYLSEKSDDITRKFKNFTDFTKESSVRVLEGEVSIGAYTEISDSISMYTLNTALTSTAGLEEFEPDEKKLMIETRNLRKWLSENRNKFKILAMHHPTNWLNNWAKSEISSIVENSFHITFSGHEHTSDLLNYTTPKGSGIQISAPALFTTKFGDLGYSITTIREDKKEIEIEYRQWTTHRKFVTGTSLANNDSGKIKITYKEENQNISELVNGINSHDVTRKIIESELTKALSSFQKQGHSFVEPKLSTESEADIKKKTLKEEKSTTISEIISNNKNYIIRALPEFGKTCLARKIQLDAWVKKSDLYIYLNFHEVKKSKHSEIIETQKKNLQSENTCTTCVIIDSWIDTAENRKYLSKILNILPKCKLLLIESISENIISPDNEKKLFGLDFETLYIWTYSRSDIRSLISSCQNIGPIQDEDIILSKLISDLDTLNLPRTPLNCLTLLKAFEVEFDDSPINRTEMIKRVLFILFNMESLPTYKDRPDLKDCEYILGHLCETMLRNSEYEFYRQDFINSLNDFCKTRVIQLDVSVVFDILFDNNIIISKNNKFKFRFTYWIYYFSAQRMHQSPEFLDFIMSNRNYTRFPEVIEFYTGIDRSGKGAIEIITNDIINISNEVRTKTGLPDGTNPYRHAKWEPDQLALDKIIKELSEEVENSNLPTEVKDHYNDQAHDRAKSYDQNIRSLFEEYSVLPLINALRAGSRALRNSDYADPESKRLLLKTIVSGWEQISKVILIISPQLAKNGTASFDGTNFTLIGSFGDTLEDRFNRLLHCIPSNVVNWYKQDIFSRKMGPLLIEGFQKEESESPLVS
jgi:predicted MPP superfamily phosphohydrolase